MPGLHQSLHNEASSSENEIAEAEDVKPTGLNLHEALDVDARFEEWLQGTCKYQCAICQKMFNTSIRFWNHIESHNIHYLKYRELHPEEHCVMKNKINCMLCDGKRVEHDKGKLLKHFRRFHPGQDIKEYYLNYVERNGQTVEQVVVEPDLGEVSSSVEESGAEQTNQNDRKRKLEAANESPSSKPRMDIAGDVQAPTPSTSGIQTQVPPSSTSRTGEAELRVPAPLNDNNNVPGLTEKQKSLTPNKAGKQNGVDDGVTHDYDAGGIDPLNMCEYTCPFCSVVYKTSWHIFKDHVKRHALDWDKPPYSYTRATMMSKKEYHECGWCNKSLQADIMYIGNHLQDKHNKMPVRDYRKMYGLWKKNR